MLTRLFLHLRLLFVSGEKRERLLLEVLNRDLHKKYRSRLQKEPWRIPLTDVRLARPELKIFPYSATAQKQSINRKNILSPAASPVLWDDHLNHCLLLTVPDHLFHPRSHE
jgi:hypothetical protein